MRNIVKGNKISSLSIYKNSVLSDYRRLNKENQFSEKQKIKFFKNAFNSLNKDELRKALLVEQGYICCYCMCTLHWDDCNPQKNNVKIEHWKPQTKYPEKVLDYDNLLAACMGGEGDTDELQTCDTKKGNKELKYNPSNRNHLESSRK